MPAVLAHPGTVACSCGFLLSAARSGQGSLGLSAQLGAFRRQSLLPPMREPSLGSSAVLGGDLASLCRKHRGDQSDP